MVSKAQFQEEGTHVCALDHQWQMNAITHHTRTTVMMPAPVLRTIHASRQVTITGRIVNDCVPFILAAVPTNGMRLPSSAFT
mmetsp:Transcript_120023/g.238965  ORF Transcript_120023/g.238965 Transcript_120023/m.238965 type:complete len:82 (+) Transcript_120023:787-1032(+)